VQLPEDRRGVAEFLLAARPNASSSWVRSNLAALMTEWITQSGARVVLEIGGGRAPLLRREDLPDGVVYIVNDLSTDELRLAAAEGHETVLFDVQDGAAPGFPYSGKCDLVLSNMVFEHLPRPSDAWSACARLLRPGGQALSVVPTLYSPPFVLNRLLPEAVTSRVLRRFFPNRTIGEIPKFPAYYRWCRSSGPYLVHRLSPLGFRRVQAVRFYGHNYFQRVPLVRQLDAALTTAASKRDSSLFSAYAAIVATR
jgi:SAM-dependent methyltransferase